MIEDFVRNMITLRKEKKLNQKELADLIGVGTRQVARYEALESKPSLEVGYNIAKALNVSLDNLCGNSTTKTEAEALQAFKSLSNSQQNIILQLMQQFKP